MRKLLSFLFMMCFLLVSSSLWAQFYTFTNAGATGINGPSQSDINTAYAGTPLAGQVTVNNGIQYWVVPSSGNYIIEATGASGGGVSGGLGAKMEGVFSLAAGDTVYILVGQEGVDGGDGSTSGGGGTYVAVRDLTSSDILVTSGSPVSPLLVAGGGGGNPGTSDPASNANTSANGNDGNGGTAFGLGGTNGNGGETSETGGNSRGGGGGGFLTDGDNSNTCGNGDEFGYSFLNGGQGGLETSCGTNQYGGGFGGGAGSISSGWRGSGGGGGYSGGGGGQTNSNATTHRGGGGGSFNAGLNQNNMIASQPGNGSVVITPLSSAPDDAGVVSVDSPTVYCPGAQDVVVTIQNFGNNIINSVNIDWTVNGVAQTTYNFTGTLDTIGGNGSSSAQVNLGSYTFTSASYNVQAWTSMPNGNADGSNSNDTSSATLQSSLPPPTGVTSSNVLSTSADFSWTAGSANNSWEYLNLPAGTSPSGSGTPVSSPSVSLTGLTPATPYDFYVREVCPGGGASSWAGSVSYATALQSPLGVNCTSGSSSVIISEQFDGSTGFTGDISTSTGDWNFETGQTGSSSTGPNGPFSGSGYIYFEGSGSGPASMVSPTIGLSAAVDSAELSFWMHAYGDDIGYLVIRASTVSATGPFNDTIFYYNQGQLQTSSSDPWQQVGVRLDQYVGQDIWLEFEADRSGSFNSDIAIDLLQIQTCGSFCLPEPTTTDSILVTDNSATVYVDTFSNNFEIEYGPCGFTQGAGTTLTGGYPINISGLVSDSCYDIYVRRDCGSGSFSNWQGPISFNTALQSPRGVNCTSGNSTVVLLEGFDGSSNFTGDISTSTGDWNYENGTTGSFATGPSGPFSGSDYIYFEGSGSGPASMVSPTIPLGSAQDSAELAFYLHAYGSDIGYLVVRASTVSATGPFTDTLFYLDSQIQTSESDAWQHIGVRLDQYVGQNIWIEFEADHISCCSADIAIDQLTVETCGSFCLPEITSVDSVVTTTTTATAYVDTFGNSFELEYGPCGFTQGNGTTVTSTNPVNITGLTSATCYEYYVRRDCGVNGTSSWAGPFTFNTGCTLSPVTLPFYENFEPASGTFVGDKSSAYCSNVVQWDFETDVQTDGRLSFDLGYSNTTIGANDSVSASMDEVQNGTPVNYLIGNIDMSNYDTSTTNFILFNFYHLDHGDEGQTNDQVWVRGSNTDSWIQVYDLEANSSSGSWVFSGDIDLTNVLRTNSQNFSSTFQVRFGQEDNSPITSQSGIDGRSFDDVSIEEVACLDIQSASFANITPNSAILNIDNDPNAAFQYEWGPCGFTQGTGTASNGTGGSANLTGLSPNTCYDVYVRRDCGASGFSSWTGPYSFTSGCILIAPFTEDFESGFSAGATGSNISPCFQSVRTNDPNWEVEDATGANENSSNTGPFYDNTNFGVAGGFYLYMETSGANAGETDTLYSGVIDVSALTTPYMELAYHMHGSDMGELKIEVFNGATWDSVFAAVGEKQTAGGDPWLLYQDTIRNLQSDSIRVRIIGEHGSNGFEGDMSIDDFSVIEAPSCIGSTLLTVENDSTTSTSTYVTWNGGQGLNYQVVWGPAGFTPPSGNQATTIDTFFTISGLSPNTAYDVYVRDSCALGYSSFEGPASFNTECLPATLPYFEDFVGSGFPTCWDRSSVSDVTYEANCGSRSDVISIQNSASITSQIIDVSGSTSLRVAYLIADGACGSAAEEDFHVDYWDGTQWVQAQSIDGNNLTSSYSSFSFILPASSYSNNFKLRFDAQQPGGTVDDWQIDSVVVEQGPSCFPPTGLTTSSLVDTSATLGWNASGAAGSYEVWFGPSGFFQGTQAAGGARAVVTGSSLVVDTLTDQSCYDFYVRAICAPGDTSSFAGPFTFCTPCSAIPAPYVEDWESLSSGTSGNFGNCWNGFSSSTGFGIYEWQTNSGTTSSGATGPNGDATTGNGIYVYTEASSGSSGDLATLESPLVDISGQSNPELTFAYHMYGSNIDTLFVDIYDGTTWNQAVMQLNEEQHSASSDPWLDTTVSLAPYSANNLVRVRFRLVSRGCCSGDAALDDIAIGDPILNDVEVTEILVNDGCGDSATAVSAVFRNNGRNTVTSLPMTANVIGNPSANLSATYTGNLLENQQDTMMIGTVNTYAGASFTVFASMNLANDQVGLNDTLQSDTFNFIPFDPIGYDTTACATDDTAYLTAEDLSGVDYGWFASSNTTTDTIPVATGDTFAVALPPTQTTYFLSYLTGTQGSLATSFAGGNGQDGNAFDILPATTININAIDVNLDGSGTQTVDVYFKTGTYVGSATTLASWTLHESVTVTSNGAGVPTNVPFTTPFTAQGGTTYGMLVAVTSGGAVDYTNGTAVGAVLAQNNDLTIYEGSGISWPLGSNFTPRFWNGAIYYGAEGCSDSRIAVDINLSSDTATASFTTTGTQPTFNFDASASVNASSYGWDFGDGNTGSGVTAQHTYASSGTYTITLTVYDSTGCISTATADTTLTVNIGMEENELQRSLDVYPNPANDVINVKFDQVGSADVELRLLDAQGRMIMNLGDKLNGSSYTKSVDVSYLASGIYILEVRSGDLKARRRITVRD